MKRFTPKYTVSYHRTFHPANIPFNIADEDAEMMQFHGLVEDVADEVQEPDVEEPPKQRRKSK